MSLKISYGYPDRVCDICGKEIHGPYYDMQLQFVNLDRGECNLKPSYGDVFEIKHDEICEDCMIKLEYMVEELRSKKGE